MIVVMYSNFNNNTSIPEKKKKKLVRCGGIILNESLTHLVGVMNYESLQDKKWGLPKGHLKNGETIQECAIREIYEETGLKVKITDDTPFKKLNDTFYYIFVIGDDTHFHIRDHREIAKVEWIPITNLNQYNMNRGLRKFRDKFDKIKFLIPSKKAFNLVVNVNNLEDPPSPSSSNLSSSVSSLSSDSSRHYPSSP